MKEILRQISPAISSFILLILFSCKERTTVPTNETIADINLKRGELIYCGPPEKEFGQSGFETSCAAKLGEEFNLAVSLLHSFEYDEAEKVFAGIIEKEPGCAMAYWGVAMSNYHPLWTPPTIVELEKGAKAISIAQSITNKTKREAAYIDAIALFFMDWEKTGHRTRSVKFEKAMEKLHAEYPNDKEATIFYALALNASADLADTSFSNQRKAGSILMSLYSSEPNHPGIVHYIIHSYDYPVLASLALPAARKYAAVAPASAHAQHMPSHIFTRLGLWDECIASNLVSTSSAKCYAENAGIKGHWDEELHGMDYLVYAYLQRGENKLAKQQCDYLKTIHEVYGVNFKVAYAFAAIPARYTLENRMWQEAASLELHPADFPWEKFPWEKSINHFARLMGNVHMGKTGAARAELQNLKIIHDTLVNQKDPYKSNQVQIMMKSGEAWILLKEGKNREAIELMRASADMEDKTEKHPVTPGEVIPARELLADMYLISDQPDKALETYEAVLKKHPNRFNALYGAGLSAEKSNNPNRAISYYQQLIVITSSSSSARRELELARTFLKAESP